MANIGYNFGGYMISGKKIVGEFSRLASRPPNLDTASQILIQH